MNSMNTRRDERGATAVLVAVLALVLLGVGAFAVDMGQVYAKRSALQSNVDMAVLAAAAKLDGTNTCTAEATAAAEHYLRENWIDDSGDPITVDLGGAKDDGDGFIQCTAWKVKLWAPQASVNFGIAKALSPDNDGVDVPAYAEAGVFSPGAGVMPAFAVTGCDYGPQTILDPPGGHESAYVPDLPEDDPFGNDADLGTLSQLSIELLESPPLTINGGSGNSKFVGVTAVAFSTEDGQHVEILNTHVAPAPTFTVVNDNQITISEIPEPVRTKEAVWWIRVSKQTGGDPSRWTDPADALAFRVGNPQLECAGESNEGNFGTIDLPHLNPSANAEKAIEWNLATKVDYDLTTLLGTSGYCPSGTPGRVVPTSDGTNCVQAKTGFAGNPATGGLITGPNGSTKGRLDTDTTAGCAPDGSSSRMQTNNKINGSYYYLNNDVLTCFFTNSTTQVQDITGAGYTGPSVISSDIFESPRFFWVPVFGVQPDAGGSNWYSIIAFRPAFITGELGGSSKSVRVMDTETTNGLVVTNSGIERLKVVFFDVDALPESMSGGPVVAYLGTGPKVIVLVD